MMISNLGFAAYLMLYDFKLDGTPEKDTSGKFIFRFIIDEDVHDKLMKNYYNSDFAKFDSILVNLKRMLPRW